MMSIQSVKKVNGQDGNLTNLWVTLTDGKELSVPIDEANTDYQKYLEWVAEGNTPEEAD